jgi:hypothetical protein
VAGAATPGIAALVKAGVAHEILHFEVITDLSDSGDFAPAQVFKTLIIALPTELAVAIVPIPAKLSLKAAADRSGQLSAELGPGVMQCGQAALGCSRRAAGPNPADRRGHLGSDGASVAPWRNAGEILAVALRSRPAFSAATATAGTARARSGAICLERPRLRVFALPESRIDQQT